MLAPALSLLTHTSASHPTARGTAPTLVLIPPLPGQANPQGLTPAPHTFPVRYFSSIWPNWSQSLLQLGPAAALRGCDSAASQPGLSTSSHKSVTDQSRAIPKGSISIKQGIPWVTQGLKSHSLCYQQGAQNHSSSKAAAPANELQPIHPSTNNWGINSRKKDNPEVSPAAHTARIPLPQSPKL